MPQHGAERRDELHIASTQAAQGEENPAQEQADRKSPIIEAQPTSWSRKAVAISAHPKRASGMASGISRARRSWAVAKRTNSKGTQAIIKLAASRKWPSAAQEWGGGGRLRPAIWFS